MIAPAPARPGFSLVELIVALTILAVGLLALAGTAVVAQRTLASADATERAARAAALVIDSLFVHDAPTSGRRAVYGTDVRWAVSSSGQQLEITTDIFVLDGHSTRHFRFHSSRPAGAAR
jgi:prepilin-type N-terminal cleavage/methylation domain-containing protein